MKILVYALLLFFICAPASAADNESDWIAREKIRAGWIFYGDGSDTLAFFKEHGMNALILNAANRETFSQWAQEAQKAAMRLIGVVGASFNGEEAGMRRCVFANGYEAVVPCPLDQRYWDEVLTQIAVDLAREGQQPENEISGILIDWELYVNAPRGGQVYYTDGCYCDHCFADFLQAQGRSDATGQVPYGERKKWLEAQDFSPADDYQAHLQAQVRRQADGLRRAVAEVDPDFFVGFYPVPHNWHLTGVAQGLGTAQHPMILWATTTYGGGGASRIDDDWREQMLASDIHCYYAGGILLRQYSSDNLAKHIYEISHKTDGYWLFPVHTLVIPEEKQRGDFHLCAGTPEDYLQAIRLANRELDLLSADPQHVTTLEFVPEPVRYRPTGFDAGRFEVPELADRSTIERGRSLEIPPLGLHASNYLMMYLEAGETPTFVFDVSSHFVSDTWGVSYEVLDPDKTQVARGGMSPGEEYSLSFEATREGIHTLVLTAGFYARCQVRTATVPYALWTWHSYPAFEVAGPGGTLYFLVPEGLAEFTLDAQCLWGTDQVNITVIDPDGQAVFDGLTHEFERNAVITVPTEGKEGRQWSVRLSPVEGKKYRSLQLKFDQKLPPAVTVRPDFLFAP